MSGTATRHTLIRTLRRGLMLGAVVSLFAVPTLGCKGCTDQPPGNNGDNNGNNDNNTNNDNNGNNGTNNGNNGTNNGNNGTNNGNNGTNNPTNNGTNMASAGTGYAPTSGGGKATNADYQLFLSIGSPQPYGQASDSDNQLIVGPIQK